MWGVNKLIKKLKSIIHLIIQLLLINVPLFNSYTIVWLAPLTKNKQEEAMPYAVHYFSVDFLYIIPI